MKPYDPTNNRWRKRRPIVTGCIDYFYDALLEVAHLSWAANQKHNPGTTQPTWARGKSTDQVDTLVRHLGERGGFDEYEITNEDGKQEIVRIRQSVSVAWRALANLQEELEREEGRPPSRASRFPQETREEMLKRVGGIELPQATDGGSQFDPADLPIGIICDNCGGNAIDYAHVVSQQSSTYCPNPRRGG